MVKGNIDMIKNEKRFKFSFLDAMLLLVFAVAVAALAYIFFGRDKGNIVKSEKVNIVYVIETKEVREELKGLVSVGDKIVDTVGHYALGEVIDVRYPVMMYNGFNNETGLFAETPYPGHVKVTITVSAEADVVNGQYSVGGYRISAGTKVYFRVPDFTYSGYCVSLGEKETR